MTTVVARWSSYAALALSLVPAALTAAYVLLPPPQFMANAAASGAAWTYASATPVTAAMAIWLGRGTRARRYGAWALGLWALVIAFLIYQFASR